MKAVFLRNEGYEHFSKEGSLAKHIRELVEFDDITIKSDISEEEITEIVQKYDILFTMWRNVKLPKMLADNPGNLKYICNITGTIKGWIPPCFIDHPTIQVTNWGNATAFSVAEGAMTLLLAVIKNLSYYQDDFRANSERHTRHPQLQGTLYNRRVGIYGMGAIAKSFVDMLRPFKCIMSCYDPYCIDLPSDVKRCDSLDELFDNSDVFVVHAGLCDGTIKTVDANRLAKLPDGGIVINTARAGIIDEDALMAELTTGRLRAGLDLMQPIDKFPPIDHPIRKLKNVICTDHFVAHNEWLIEGEYLFGGDDVAIENLKHFIKGEPLEFTFDMQRYNLST